MIAQERHMLAESLARAGLGRTSEPDDEPQ
jgi:hypothetical protein